MPNDLPCIASTTRLAFTIFHLSESSYNGENQDTRWAGGKALGSSWFLWERDGLYYGGEIEESKKWSEIAENGRYRIVGRERDEKEGVEMVFFSFFNQAPKNYYPPANV